MFYVGQKVVCVDASAADDGNVYLVEKAIYTVRGFSRVDRYGMRGLKIEGIYPKRPGYTDGFRISRFRPLTDISVFTAMLDRAPTPEAEPVE